MAKEHGEFARPNPNSALVWHCGAPFQAAGDANGRKAGNAPLDSVAQMHRTLGSVAICRDLLFVADYSGMVHCLNAKDGTPNWHFDMMAAAWCTPLIVEDKVYIGNEDGNMLVFKLSAQPQREPIAKVKCGSAIYTSPIVANNTMYVADRNTLMAIASRKWVEFLRLPSFRTVSNVPKRSRHRLSS